MSHGSRGMRLRTLKNMTQFYLIICRSEFPTFSWFGHLVPSRCCSGCRATIRRWGHATELVSGSGVSSPCYFLGLRPPDCFGDVTLHHCAFSTMMDDIFIQRKSSFFLSCFLSGTLVTATRKATNTHHN